jgi:DNA-binding NarL/FixJ family response regulator
LTDNTVDKIEGEDILKSIPLSIECKDHGTGVMEKPGLYQIAVVDDHPMVLQGIKRVIEEDPELTVVATLSDGLHLVDFLRQTNPQMVVLDLSMPRMGGIEATRHLKANYPGIKVLILTMHRGEDYVAQAMTAGAHGYLLKQEADQSLLIAIAALRQGETFLSPSLSGQF